MSHTITVTALWSSLNSEERVAFMTSMLKAAYVKGVNNMNIRAHVGPLSNPNKLAVKLGMHPGNTVCWTDTFATQYATRTQRFTNDRNAAHTR